MKKKLPLKIWASFNIFFDIKVGTNGQRRETHFRLQRAQATSQSAHVLKKIGHPEVSRSIIHSHHSGICFSTSSVSIAHCISKCGTNLNPRIILVVGLVLVGTPAM